VIYHITTLDELHAAMRVGIYRSATLSSEGFIHCSYLEQVAGSANRHFKGQRELVVLFIDETRVTAPIKVENGFPHVYGPLPMNAVTKAVLFEPGPDGQFQMPDGSADANAWDA
jgi:uncharacterized protein (DUF952 family)